MKLKKKEETQMIHGGWKPESNHSIMQPIYQTSSYYQDSLTDRSDYFYTRFTNPTRDALDQRLATLENAKHAFSVASGVAAIDLIFRLLHKGDKVLCTKDVYGGTHTLLTDVYAKVGIKFEFVDCIAADKICDKICDKTKMVWLETPSNPTLKILDLKAISRKIKAKNPEIMVVVDNTFASPYLQKPLELGCDIVMHSVSKYLGGHSDVIMGAVVLNDDRIADELKKIRNVAGNMSAPFDCFLVLRGIMTLHLRMERQCENTEKVAKYLKTRPELAKVYWPGFKDHNGHDIAKKQMKHFGAVTSVVFNDDSVLTAQKFLSKLKLFHLAFSLGGAESMVNHPASMSHSAMDKLTRESIGVNDSLLRLSIGIEHSDDIIEALEYAFTHMNDE